MWLILKLPVGDVSTWYKFATIEYVNNLDANIVTMSSPIFSRTSFNPPILPKKSKTEKTDLL